MKVSLEDYKIKEEAKQGLDIVVSIKLKQYRNHGTKNCKVPFAKAKPQAKVETKRETTASPAPKSNQTYTVKKGDCLWNIAKSFYGNGSRYTVIANANKDKIKNPNLFWASVDHSCNIGGVHMEVKLMIQNGSKVYIPCC